MTQGIQIPSVSRQQLKEIKAMKISKRARELIRTCAGTYENGKRDALELLRVHDLSKRGELETLEMAVESISDTIEELKRIQGKLKKELPLTEQEGKTSCCKS